MAHSKKEDKRNMNRKKNSQRSDGENEVFVKMGEEIAKITKKYD